MKLKLEKILVVMLVCIMGFSIPVFAKTERAKPKGPIFMGKVLEVEAKDKFNNIRIRTKGYIKGCEVYEEELFVIISEDTKFMTSNCAGGEKCDKDKLGEKKCEKTDTNIKVGDTVFICLSEIMTNSIPPQVVARKIQVTKMKS